EQPGRADALADREGEQEVLPEPVLRHDEVEVVSLLVGVEETGAIGGAAGQLGERLESVLGAGLAALRLPGGLLRPERGGGSARAQGTAGHGRRGEDGEDEGRPWHGHTPYRAGTDCWQTPAAQGCKAGGRASQPRGPIGCGRGRVAPSTPAPPLSRGRGRRRPSRCALPPRRPPCIRAVTPGGGPAGVTAGGDVCRAAAPWTGRRLVPCRRRPRPGPGG